MESYTLNANAEVVLAARWSRTPAVIDLHDIVVAGLGRKVLGAGAALAAATIANSAATAATVARGRVEVIHPGIDLTRFHPGPADPPTRARLCARPDRPVVGILGRMDPEKGIDVLGRAMAGLEGPAAEAQLAVVGAPLGGGESYAATLRAELTRGLGERVRFVPPTDDVPGVMRALDVLVNASRAEPFGLTVLEAQACGTPVVAAAAGGIPEFVVDGKSGLLVTPGDELALARSLERMLGDERLRHAVVCRGVADAADKSIDRQAKRIADLYRSVCR